MNTALKFIEKLRCRNYKLHVIRPPCPPFAPSRWQVENYAAASELELQLTSMVDSLNILIRELLHQASTYPALLLAA
jgi:hypothetical protein